MTLVFVVAASCSGWSLGAWTAFVLASGLICGVSAWVGRSAVQRHRDTEKAEAAWRKHFEQRNVSR